MNSVTVSQMMTQAPNGPDALTTTYYNAKGWWQAAPAMSLRLEVEGGRDIGHPGTVSLGSSLGSQWSLNEVQEESDLFVAVLHAEGADSGGRFRWQLGKISPKGAFDDNRAARAKLTKFIAEPLVKNSAVPFAAKGLGGVAQWAWTQSLLVTLCASDANASSTQAGFSTWRGEWFRGAEVTVRPQPGATCRLLVWGTERAGMHDDGWGASADWEVVSDWVVFARAGGGSEQFAHTRRLVSAGLAWEKPFNRPGDFLAVGFARGEALRDGGGVELLTELVYRWQVNRWVALSPDIQHIRQPAHARASGAWVFGLRCALTLVK